MCAASKRRIPARAATRAARGLVIAAFDRDATGERLWESLRSRYPDAQDITRAMPATGKDWNDALCIHQQGARRDRGAQGRGR